MTAIGQLGTGQTLNAEDAALGLRLANLLLDKASTRRLYLFYVNSRSCPLLPGVPSFTVGPSGTVVGTRPTLVESAQINVPGTSIWLPISVWNKAEWDAMRNKGAQADIPDGIYVAPTFPNLTVNVNPLVRAVPTTLQLGTWETLAQFVTVLDQIAFPPAYEEWLESTLAVMMAPFYDMPVPQLLAVRMTDADQAVREHNAQSLPGALSEAQRLQSPNVGAPPPPSPAGAAQ
jgi:hypothetical protein